MPKPLILRRPSGLYVRFLVPLPWRAVVGSRFIVRSLGSLRGDAARLEAARLGYALAQEFARMKRMAKPKDQNGEFDLSAFRRVVVVSSPFTADERVNYACEMRPDGSARIEADGPEDHARALEAMREMRATPAAPLAIPTAPKSSAMLGDRIDLFMRQFRQKQRATNNVLDTGHTLRLLLGVVGDRPLVDVDAESMDLFLDAIAHWPPNASKKPVYRDLTPSQVVAKAKRMGGKTISDRTQEKHLDRLRVFFNWSMARRDIDRNPAATLHVMTRDQEEAHSRRAFTDAELSTLFDPTRRATHCQTPVRSWLPLVALYTGARAQELAQLRTDDVEEVTGIWGVHLATRFTGQRVKNTKTRRFVPLHPALLAAGFLDYLADVLATVGPGPLFPGLGARSGDSLGDWFNRTYLRGACGIHDGMVFHCFRNTFATTADRLGIGEGRIARITGHSQGGSILRTHYIDAPTLPERAAAMSSMVFNVPPVAVYQRGQFSDFLAKVDQSKRHRMAAEKRAARGNGKP
jgi:integrase